MNLLHGDFGGKLFHFVRVHALDRQTDRQTDFDTKNDTLTVKSVLFPNP